MTTIRDELRAELTDAMKAKDRPRTEVIRQIESDVAVARSAPGFEGEVDDELYIDTMASYVKRMTKARDEFAAAGERGRSHVARLTFEIDYVSRWLPESAGEDETRALVQRTIGELGGADTLGPKAAGMVIGRVMGSSAGLDGALVSRIVREELDG